MSRGFLRIRVDDRLFPFAPPNPQTLRISRVFPPIFHLPPPPPLPGFLLSTPTCLRTPPLPDAHSLPSSRIGRFTWVSSSSGYPPFCMASTRAPWPDRTARPKPCHWGRWRRSWPTWVGTSCEGSIRNNHYNSNSDSDKEILPLHFLRP